MGNTHLWATDEKVRHDVENAAILSAALLEGHTLVLESPVKSAKQLGRSVHATCTKGEVQRKREGGGAPSIKNKSGLVGLEAHQLFSSMDKSGDADSRTHGTNYSRTTAEDDVHNACHLGRLQHNTCTTELCVAIIMSCKSWKRNRLA